MPVRTQTPANVKLMLGISKGFEAKWEEEAQRMGMDRNHYARQAIQQRILNQRLLVRGAPPKRNKRASKKLREVSVYVTEAQAEYLHEISAEVPRWNKTVALGYILGEQLGFLPDPVT